MLRAAGLGFFGEAAPSSGEGSDLCPVRDPHFLAPGFYLLPKDHRNFRAEGPTPFLWQEWGTLSLSFSPEQELLHLGLWGWEDPLALGEPAWHDPCPWSPAWHRRASLARSMAPGVVAVPWPWLCPSANPELPAWNKPPYSLTEGSFQPQPHPALSRLSDFGMNSRQAAQFLGLHLLQLPKGLCAFPAGAIKWEFATLGLTMAPLFSIQSSQVQRHL